jgi:hypothetical protein
MRYGYRRSKYNAVKTVVNGIKFASKLEAARYMTLIMELKDGKITDLTLQPVFKFPCGIKYVADFKYTEKGRAIYEDVKGFKPPVFNLKMKCFKFHYPNEELKITK